MFQMSIIEMCIQCTFCMKKRLMFFGIGQMHSCIEGVSNYKVGLSVKAGQLYDGTTLAAFKRILLPYIKTARPFFRRLVIFPYSIYIYFLLGQASSRVSSYIMMPAATAAFSDSAPPRMGSFSLCVAVACTAGDTPLPSLPMTSTNCAATPSR